MSTRFKIRSVLEQFREFWLDIPKELRGTESGFPKMGSVLTVGTLFLMKKNYLTDRS